VEAGRKHGSGRRHHPHAGARRARGEVLVTAIEERRPVKAGALVLVIIVLLVICTSGGYLSIGGGIEVDSGP
jgi:hypothetical protein